MIIYYWKKVKLHCKYCSAALPTAFTTKFLLEAEVQSSVFEIYQILVFTAEIFLRMKILKY